MYRVYGQVIFEREGITVNNIKNFPINSSTRITGQDIHRLREIATLIYEIAKENKHGAACTLVNCKLMVQPTIDNCGVGEKETVCFKQKLISKLQEMRLIQDFEIYYEINVLPQNPKEGELFLDNKSFVIWVEVKI